MPIDGDWGDEEYDDEGEKPWLLEVPFRKESIRNALVEYFVDNQDAAQRVIDRIMADYRADSTLKGSGKMETGEVHDENRYNNFCDAIEEALEALFAKEGGYSQADEDAAVEKAFE